MKPTLATTLRVATALVIALVPLTGIVAGQTVESTILGTVKDQSGAAVLQSAGPVSVTSGNLVADAAAFNRNRLKDLGPTNNRLKLGALVQSDGRLAIARHDATDSFVMRRVRPIVQGRVARHFDYYVVADFASRSPDVRDAYIDARLSSALRMRIGKSKVPFGLERLHPANALLFVERALPTAVAPDRGVGLHLLGNIGHGRVTYAGGIFDSAGDGWSSDAYAGHRKDVAGRIVVSPWAANPRQALSGAGIGVAAATAPSPRTMPSFRSAARQTFFSYAGGTGDGRQYRVSPQAFYYYGPFGGFAEYVRSSGRIRTTFAASEVSHAAWQVAASWVVTGEHATERGVGLQANSNRGNHRFGALQVAARYHELRIDRRAFSLGLAATGASRTAQAFTAGVNWYMNPLVKWVCNVERTVFDGDPHGPRPAENTVLLRGQLSF